jgi:hypothetical protein
MKKSKLDTAMSLAKAHFRVEPNLKRVYLIEPLDDEDPNDPIKLLEVVEGTIERGIDPIAFSADPAHGIEYPLIIVEISPSEYEDMRRGKLGFVDLAQKRLGELRKKRTVTISSKRRRDLASKVEIGQELAKRRNPWTVGKELLAR